MTDLPAISGKQLIALLLDDGWTIKRKKKHVSMSKEVDGKNLVTVIKDTNDPLPDGTLSAILSSKQTRLGKSGFRRLLFNPRKKKS